MALNASLIKRLSLLKYSLKEADNYLKELTDEYAFATGANHLHDAIENLFWAISQYSKVNLTDKNLPDKYNQLMIPKLKNKISFDKTNIVDLNAIRNNFKHHGILPNISQTTAITAKLNADFEDTIKNVFNIDLSTISLSMLIANDDLRGRVQAVEKIINSRKASTTNYKEALAETGRIFFEYYERNSVKRLSVLLSDLRDEQEGKTKERYKFVDRRVDEISRDLLELGLTPYYYYRFKNLVPEYGLDRKENKIIQKVSTPHWGKENWTKLNATFCINWLIDYILRQQQIYSRKDYDIKIPTSRCHILKAKESFTSVLKEIRDNFDEYTMQFEKGKKYLGYFLDYAENEWQDYKDDLKTGDVIIYFPTNRLNGYVPKEAFEIKESHSDEISDEEMNELMDNGTKGLDKVKT